MAQWREARPDLDVSPQGVIGRLHRLADRLTEELVAVYSQFGLGEGEFDVLATLAAGGRAVRAHARRPGRLDHGVLGRGHQAGRPLRRSRAG